ncbi:MAG: FAD-dependent monooxygenase [Acidobacteriota bacterium]|nr:FAD-dependent monooxygenase [Acidobacteriota bacterium]
MPDVIVAGGGPAGALAAILLARAGARVRVFERARFPRHKLCGDTLNPGALAVLARHLDTTPLLANSDVIDGMVITGPGGVSVRGRYGRGLSGRAITREVFDHWLIAQAADAGAEIDEGVAVRDVTATTDGGRTRINGVIVQGGGSTASHTARMVIAADGRRSSLAFGRGLARQPARPRRWAIGAYFTGVTGLTTAGEMHVRDGHYIGVAPLPGGLTNACLVVPHAHGDEAMKTPARVLDQYLGADAALAPRFAAASPAGPVVMLGPMAVDSLACGEPGLLLAGDAAGFIDPMTGDGLRLALAGAELAAAVTLDVLAGRVAPDQAHTLLAARRRAAFQSKWRFNRTLRSLVASPRGVTAAALAARALPSVFERMIRYAGDC